jgi:hypothetical protein
MRATLHRAIETMEKGAFDDLWAEPKDKPWILELTKRARVFDFGTLRPSEEHIDFALELYDKSLFRLPYPITAFHVMADDGHGALVVMAQQEPKLMASVVFVNIGPDPKKPAGLMPAVLSSENVHASVLSTKKDDYVSRLLLSQSLFRRTMGPGFLDEMVQWSDFCTVQCMGFVAMLMSKGVETTHIPAPTKLNKARAKQKKPPIGERYVVTINLKAVRHGDGELGHTRGSPCPHWRRGHMRRWTTTTGEPRLIPIPPTLVAVREDCPVATPIYKAKA